MQEWESTINNEASARCVYVMYFRFSSGPLHMLLSSLPPTEQLLEELSMKPDDMPSTCVHHTALKNHNWIIQRYLYIPELLA